MPRYFLIASKEKFSEENENPVFDLTPALMDLLREYINYNKNIPAQIARFTFEADQYFLRFKSCIKGYIRKSREEDLKYDAVFARLAEHAQKLSLITAQKKYTKNNDFYYEIGLEGLEWAVAVVVSSARQILKIMDESFSENVIEENHKRVLNVIRDVQKRTKDKDRWIRRRDIFRKCRFVNAQTLESLLLRYEIENLIELKPGARKGRGLLVRIKIKGEKSEA